MRLTESNAKFRYFLAFFVLFIGVNYCLQLKDFASRKFQDALSEAREVLEQYELEVREQPQTERQKLTWRLKSYKTEYQEMVNFCVNTSVKTHGDQRRLF